MSVCETPPVEWILIVFFAPVEWILMVFFALRKFRRSFSFENTSMVDWLSSSIQVDGIIHMSIVSFPVTV
jgi:hypothetical protein